MEKKDIHKLGHIKDSQNRKSKARKYAGDWAHWVKEARHFIYDLGYSVASAAVNRVLYAASWVPTMVCDTTLCSLLHFYC